jgi:hypothetical protein
MKIKLHVDPNKDSGVDPIELRERAYLWLRRVRDLIKNIVVRIVETVTTLRADERVCEIEAHLESGQRIVIHARGRAAVIAFERALRRLMHSLQSQRKRDDAVRHFRALAAT